MSTCFTVDSRAYLRRNAYSRVGLDLGWRPEWRGEGNQTEPPEPDVTALNNSTLESRITGKMEAAGISTPTIRSFLAAVQKVRAGDRGIIPEADIEPVLNLPRLAELPPGPDADRGRLRELAVVKLNGGLGTSMGLERAKSLIAVKGAESFLDFIARQILQLRAGGSEPAFYLMNSFSTRSDTLEALARHSALSTGEPLDFLQSKVPKIDLTTYEPSHWPKQPDLEWCPPGHGDLYASLAGAGLLRQLLDRGIRYLFVSNADNLGATVDPRLLHYFANSNQSFLMEVADRTAADRKGGHLARRRSSGRLVLRESAQALASEESQFQDTDRHRYFNTNNLWVRLDHLEEELNRHQGAFPLPLITNTKTVDPKDPNSPRVMQLESAMGAAIECFERGGAIAVDRERFAPVKTTSDLLAVRSDAYRVTPDHRVVLDPARSGRPPLVVLDGDHYRVMARFDDLFQDGVPSLIRCDRLQVTGPVRFPAGVVCEGQVEFSNRSGREVSVEPGVYRDTRRDWP